MVFYRRKKFMYGRRRRYSKSRSSFPMSSMMKSKMRFNRLSLGGKGHIPSIIQRSLRPEYKYSDLLATGQSVSLSTTPIQVLPFSSIGQGDDNASRIGSRFLLKSQQIRLVFYYNTVVIPASQLVRAILVHVKVSLDQSLPAVGDILSYVNSDTAPFAASNVNLTDSYQIVKDTKAITLDQYHPIKVFNWFVPSNLVVSYDTDSDDNVYPCTNVFILYVFSDQTPNYPYLSYLYRVRFIDC